MSEPMDSTDPLELLRSANPYPPASDPAHEGLRSSDAERLFQEIIMTDPAAPTAPVVSPAERPFGPAPTKDDLAPRRRARPGRRFAISGVAAASAAAIGIGAVVLSPASTTPAQAAVIDAAQATQDADSGTASIVFTGDDGTGPIEIRVDTRFDGANLSATFAGSETLGTDMVGEVRLIDGVVYADLGSGSWIAVDDPRLSAAITSFGLPIEIGTGVSAAIADLVEQADDVEELGPDHYRATVTVDEASQLLGQLPDMGPVADEDLPADIAQTELTVELRLDGNGLIDTLVVSGAGIAGTDMGSATGSITVDLNDLGTEQAIEVPADVEEFDISSLLGDN